MNIEKLNIYIIQKGPIGDIPWHNIKRKFRLIFSGHETKIMILKHEITISRENERIQIIRDNHSTPVGGHKGVSKTYWRIKQKYYWSNLKAEIQTYIQNCRSCQTRKLARQENLTTNDPH